MDGVSAARSVERLRKFVADTFGTFCGCAFDFHLLRIWIRLSQWPRTVSESKAAYVSCDNEPYLLLLVAKIFGPGDGGKGGRDATDRDFRSSAKIQ